MVERGKGNEFARCNTNQTPQEQIPDLFPTDKAGTLAAKKFCRPCPERDACLERALDEKIPDGIWGGRTPRERNVIAKLKKQGIIYLN